MYKLRFPEKARQHPVISLGLVLALVAGALELDGYFENKTYNVPENSCTSPFTVSESYVDHDASILLQTDTGIDTTGVIAKGSLPDQAYGVQVAFENPNEHGVNWTISQMVKPNVTDDYTLKTAIGSGEVEFGLRVVAPEGSVACDAAPNVIFKHEGTGDYATADASIPWPNPANIAVNALLHHF
jgi:hypothetical protein